MKVVIMRGIPGSGKSTYAGMNYPDALTVSADNYFMVNGIYQFDPKKLGIAHATCFRQFLDGLTQGVETIVVDNTSTTVSEISPYHLGACAFGYDHEIVTMECSVDVAMRRNVHGVPEQAYKGIVERFSAGTVEIETIRTKFMGWKHTKICALG